ncbi:MAG: putative cytokinetic ring protein SteA [bacterium]|nr:putative cytokinetic ring protein SteA [bacterium]
MSPKPVRAPEKIEGPVRVDRDIRALARRLEPGDIAVIDLADIDRESAELLIARKPAAVLDAATAATGRLPALGSTALLEAGIALVDGFGTDILELREGTRVHVDGGVARVDDAEFAEGRPVTREHLEAASTQAREGAPFQLDAVSAATSELLTREHALVLDGEGLPALEKLAGRPALVIAERATTPEALTRLRPWIREARPVIVAVEAGADAARAAGLTPDVIIGPLESVSGEALASGAQLVLHLTQDGRSAGRTRAEELGTEHSTVVSSLPSVPLALLLAGHGVASVVVAAGTDESLEEVVDGGRNSAAALGLARLALGDRLVSASAVPRLTRPRIRAWQLALLVLAALLALAVALLTTPVGQAALGTGPDWLKNLFGALPKEELWSISATTSYL